MTAISEPNRRPTYQVAPFAMLVARSGDRIVGRPVLDVYLDSTVALDNDIALLVGAGELPSRSRRTLPRFQSDRRRLTEDAHELATQIRMNEENVLGWLRAEQNELGSAQRRMNIRWLEPSEERWSRIARFEAVASAARRAIAFEHMLAWRILAEAGAAEFSVSEVAAALRDAQTGSA